MQCFTYVCGVHKPCPLLREETVPAMHVVNSRFRLCTSVVPRQMSVVFGLGTRLHVCMLIDLNYSQQDYLDRDTYTKNSVVPTRPLCIATLGPYRSMGGA